MTKVILLSVALTSAILRNGVARGAHFKVIGIDREGLKIRRTSMFTDGALEIFITNKTILPVNVTIEIKHRQSHQMKTILLSNLHNLLGLI